MALKSIASICPLSAHIRKTRPRADLGPRPENVTSFHHIVRAGIPYGPEGEFQVLGGNIRNVVLTISDSIVTIDETYSKTTEIERGLAFGELDSASFTCHTNQN
jgi:deferrochelatase/peroxidase EfeB